MLWLCIIQMVCLVRAKQGWGTGTFLHYAIVRLLLKSGVKRNFVWHTRRQSTGRGQGVKTMWLYFWFLVLPISVFKLVSILLLFVSSIFSIQHAYYLLWFNQVHFARLKICLLFSYIGVVKSLCLGIIRDVLEETMEVFTCSTSHFLVGRDAGWW